MSKPRFPLIGRSAERARLRALFTRTQGGHGGVVFLVGESGVGKSRLAGAAAEDALKRDWQVAAGRAHPVERTIAFALADAFVPLLQALPPGRLDILARGAVDHLATLFPVLRPSGAHRSAEVSSSAELFYSFAQVVKGLTDQRPLLVVLDDLQWADPSSLDLLHFLARQISDSRIAIVCAVNTEDANKAWRTVHQSLQSMGIAESIAVEPFAPDDLMQLVRQAGVSGAAAVKLTRDLYERTRGNPFFAEEILKQVSSSQRADDIVLPGSVREVVLARLDGLGAELRTLTERIAVIGTSVSYDLVHAVTGIDESLLVELLEAAVRANVLVEGGNNRELTYDFRHPLLRETLYAELSGARRRLLHTQVAQALETLHAPHALDHAAEIAPHLIAGDARRFGLRAAQYLAGAGEVALNRFADREANDYLSAASELLDADVPAAMQISLLRNVARARQRLGRFDEAVTLLAAARDLTPASDGVSLADTSRRIATALFLAGRYNEALNAYGEALTVAEHAGDPDLLGRIYIERGSLLQGIGRVPEATADLTAALAAAEATGSATLLARAERALLLFHTLSGPAERARYHSGRAVAAAEQSGDDPLLCTCHWAAAVLSGMTGNSDGCKEHITRGYALADKLRSPLLRLAVDEIAIEYAYGLGEWDHACDVGETAIDLARSLNQRSLLTRLLVWTSLVYLGRDDIARAVPMIDEAWDLAVAGASKAERDIHSVVPAHIGRVALHMARLEFDDAIRVAEAALAFVDQTGYRAWAVHRLLPTLAEAYLHQGNADGATRISTRLRQDAAILDNTLGLAWADTGDAFVRWLQGDLPGAIDLLRSAADALDAVPFVSDAARLRRQLAGRLADYGDRDGALRELRHVHDVFTRLGAARELEKTRIQFREIGARPPVRAAGPGVAGLTSRELEIVRLVADRKSNKAIARELNVSARTITTHLSNIFRKLAVSTRGELTDYARTLTLD